MIRFSARGFVPRAIVWGAIFAVLSSCAVTGPRSDGDGAELPHRARRVFAASLDQVQDRYVRSVDMGQLVELGVVQVVRLDPEARLSLRRVGDSLELQVAGEPTPRTVATASGGTAGWAAAAVTAIEAARGRSAALRTLDAERTQQAFFEGMVKGLDSYSRYTSPEAAREERAQREGFGGLGIVIDTENGDVRIATVMEDTPAARAGLRPDDRILTIDGEPTQGMVARDVVRRLRGAIGSTVEIRVRRADRPAGITVALVRAHIVPQTVSYRAVGDVAHIRVTGFNHRTTETLVETLRRAEREIGPGMSGVVLDLRNNFGGYLDQAIYVADLFLAEGTIVSTRGRHRTVTQESWARRGDIGERTPLVVLINGNSASASEIVAAALQDNNRAVVIGTASFGKGSVQSILPLPNEGELILTSARFHAPSGYALSELGVLPHLCTTGGRASAATLVQQLRGGQFADQAAARRWRSIGIDDPEARRRLRAQSCAGDTAEHESDLELARAILADRSLHAMALASTATLATATPR
ncbi:MAG: S41 family peptidase [Rhodospirillales bacterium]